MLGVGEERNEEMQIGSVRTYLRVEDVGMLERRCGHREGGFSFPYEGKSYTVRSNSVLVCMRFSYVGGPYRIVNVKIRYAEITEVFNLLFLFYIN
jgi:hypothetical protein